MRIFHFLCAGRAAHAGLLLLLLLVAAPAISAPAPSTIGFTGRLTTPAGAPLPNGPYSVLLSLYDASTGGLAVWSETMSVHVTDGLFSTALGSVVPLPDTLDFSKAYFVGVRAGADPEMQPRLALQGVPYALFAHDLAPNSVGSSKLRVDSDSLTAVSGGVLATRATGARYEITQTIQNVLTPAGEVWQSFTPDEAMVVHSIELRAIRPTSASSSWARLDVYEGEGTQGRLLGGGSTIIPPGDNYIVFNLDAPVLARYGATHTFHITPPGDTHFRYHNQNAYDGGRLSLDANADLWFVVAGATGNLTVRGGGDFDGPLKIAETLNLRHSDQATPGGISREDQITNLDYNFRLAGLDNTLRGGAVRIDGRFGYPLFQFLSRVPGVPGEPILAGITHDGNVGIGITDPQNGLVVAKGAGEGGSLDDGVHLGIDIADNAHIELVGGMPYIDFNTDNTSDNKARIILSATDTLQVAVPKLYVNGTLSKKAGSFRIDHPLDPENKYLCHSFVESPDMMNVYNGNVTLDANGRAEVTLPGWFEALNRDFRYQLTPIGGPGPDLYIAKEIRGNRFSIAGGRPGLRVSWMVTGIRHDRYADEHRIPVEEDKPPAEKGGVVR